MKLCKDCKYYVEPTIIHRLLGNYGKCAHPKNLDKVTGEIVLYAGEARSHFDPATPDGRECGPAAWLFEVAR